MQRILCVIQRRNRWQTIPSLNPWYVSSSKTSHETHHTAFKQFSSSSEKVDPKALLSEVDEEMKKVKDKGTTISNRTGDSLFDVFRIPEPPAQRKPNAFELESYQEYLEIVNSIIEHDPKFLRRHTANPVDMKKAEKVIEYLRLDEPTTVPIELKQFDKALKTGYSTSKEASRIFRSEIYAQKERFMAHMGFDKLQHRIAEGALTQTVNMCAKNVTGRPVHVLWSKVKEMGISYRPLLGNLLYVSSTFTMGVSHQKGNFGVGSSIIDILQTNGSEDSGPQTDVTEEIAIYHDLLHKPTDESVSVRARFLVANGFPKEAELLLDEYSNTTSLRLRAYFPVLQLYLDNRDMLSALRLYRKMQAMPSVHLECETYIAIIAGLAENGHLHPQAEAIRGIEKLGFSASSGPQLLDDIASDMSNEFHEISLASAKRLYNAFAEGFSTADRESTSSLAPLRLDNERADDNDLITSRVVVDPETGICPRSGSSLRLINLNEAQAEQLKEGILSLARTGQLKYEAESSRTAKIPADELLMKFYGWLDRRTGDPFTAICDGPNLGFYMQNFEDGGFSWHQIKFVVDSLENLKENPLVLMPRKYMCDEFFMSLGGSDLGTRKQILTNEEIAIRNELEKKKRLAIIPSGHLDDFFAILASVSKQSTARQGRDISVPPNNPDGRWPGIRPIVVSNDQFRDHKLELLEPMLFRRWYSNYIVNYNFAAFVDGVCVQKEIGFSPIDFFSREIQGNDTPSGMAWHFPLKETDNEWFCIRIPSK